MFPRLKYLEIGGGASSFCSEPVEKEIKDGPFKKKVYIKEMVNCSKKLPPVDSTDLRACLAAGVPLQRVNPVLKEDVDVGKAMQQMTADLECGKIKIELKKNQEQPIETKGE